MTAIAFSDGVTARAGGHASPQPTRQARGQLAIAPDEGVGSPTRAAPGRSGSLIPPPTVSQLRAARAVLRRAADPAALVAHAAAAVMPYELGQWPPGRADTGIGCAALYLAWRAGGRRDLAATMPGPWPWFPDAAWTGAVKALGLASATDDAGQVPVTPAERVEYVAWRLGTGLAAVQWTVTAAHAARIAAANALHTAWRDELALAERQRRLAEFDAWIDAQADVAAPVGGAA